MPYPQPQLTASEFLAAFYRDEPLSPSASGVQLRDLERAVLNRVPAPSRSPKPSPKAAYTAPPCATSAAPS